MNSAYKLNKQGDNIQPWCTPFPIFSLKNDRMISVRFQGKPFNIMVIQVYALISNAKKAEVEQF